MGFTIGSFKEFGGALGTKFHWDSQELCEKTLIDHWITSQDHLEIDKLITNGANGEAMIT
jgi:hypothetical protein